MTNNVHNFTRDLPWSKQNGSDGGGGSMEARIARLKSDVGYIKRDIGEIKTDIKEMRSDIKSQLYWLIGVGITVAAALFGTMAWGFTTLISILPH